MKTFEITYREAGAKLRDTDTIRINASNHAGAQIYFHQTFPDWTVVRVRRAA